MLMSKSVKNDSEHYLSLIVQNRALRSFLEKVDQSVEGCPLVDVKFVSGTVEFIFKKPYPIRVLDGI